MQPLIKALVVASAVTMTLSVSAVADGAHRHNRTRHVAAGHHHPRSYAYGRGPAYLPTGPYGPNAVDYPAPSAADDPYNPYAAPGAAVRAMARRNQFAPGVTNELAPDNIATATGGPSGGVPGFSSH